MNRAVRLTALCLTLLLATAKQGRCEQLPSLDVAPTPVDGMSALAQAVVYPKSALADSLEGRVLVSAQISATGTVKSVEVMTGVRKDLDDAALEAVRTILWTPAKKNDKPVESSIIVPIQFKLDATKRK